MSTKAGEGQDYLVQDEAQPEPIDTLIAREDSAYLPTRLAELPETARSLLHGLYWQEKSCQELGKEYGLNYDTVKVRLFRARRRLRSLERESSRSRIPR